MVINAWMGVGKNQSLESLYDQMIIMIFGFIMIYIFNMIIPIYSNIILFPYVPYISIDHSHISQH